MEQPRWLVDEMLGRLCRYLRFLGYDADYAHGLTDDEIVRRARTETRRLITRDRDLSRRVPGSVLLTQTDIAGQVGELRRAVPDLSRVVRFERCTLCNGRLAPVLTLTLSEEERSRVPPDVLESASIFRCSACNHLYWEGTHTRSVQDRMARWLSSEA